MKLVQVSTIAGSSESRVIVRMTETEVLGLLVRPLRLTFTSVEFFCFGPFGPAGSTGAAGSWTAVLTVAAADAGAAVVVAAFAAPGSTKIDSTKPANSEAISVSVREPALTKLVRKRHPAPGARSVGRGSSRPARRSRRPEPPCG